MGKERTACFSGYRPQKFGFELRDGVEAFRLLKENIESEAIKAIEAGYVDFICGMANGFDLLCGECIVALRRGGPSPREGLRLIAAAPYRGHGFGGRWGEIYGLVISEASEVVYVSGEKGPEAYLARNRYMVDNSSLLICYYDGLPGGTRYTVSYARKRGLRVVNLCGEAGEDGWGRGKSPGPGQGRKGK